MDNNPQPVQPPSSTEASTPAPQPQIQSPQPQYPSGPSSKKKSNLGLILGLVGGAVFLLIAAIVAVIIVISLNSVSKADYEKANTSYEKIYKDYSTISGVYVSSSLTDTEIKNSVDKLKSAKSSFDTDYKALAESKAVKKDKDLSEKFKAVEVKKAAFDTYIATEIEALNTVGPIIADVNEANQSSDANTVISALTKAKSDLEGLNLKQKVNKDYVSALTSALSDALTAANTIKSSPNYNSTATNQLYDAIDKLSDADRDWTSNLDKLRDDAKINDPLNDFDGVLAKKIY